MRVSTALLCGVVVSSSAVAAPAPASCKAVNDVIAVLQLPELKGKATAFCSSYLHYPSTATSTVTVTPTQTQQTTLPDVTATTTAAVTQTDAVTATITAFQGDPTVTVTATVTAGTRTVYQKRDLRFARRDVPANLKRFIPAKISSACSCIVTPSTTTVIQTATANAATVTQTVGAQGTVVVTQTTVVHVTVTEAATLTVGPTSTVTEVALSTVTPILVKPKICNARGLPGANAFNYDANFNSNQAACIASCKTDNRCLATGFYLVTDPSTGSQTGTCRKYDKSVTDSADLGPGYYNFNDKNC